MICRKELVDDPCIICKRLFQNQETDQKRWRLPLKTYNEGHEQMVRKFLSTVRTNRYETTTSKCTTISKQFFRKVIIFLTIYGSIWFPTRTGNWYMWYREIASNWGTTNLIPSSHSFQYGGNLAQFLFQQHKHVINRHLLQDGSNVFVWDTNGSDRMVRKWNISLNCLSKLEIVLPCLFQWIEHELKSGDRGN